MGVPGFIYWLVTNVIDSIAEKEDIHKADKIVYPIHSQKVLVQDVIKQRVDNFYIDLNGLIHPCCHPQLGKKPENEEEMFQQIIAELLVLARTVRPSNLFYIAVDGVAPAAKQEQQRHRRFVAISENAQKTKVIDKIQQVMEKEKEELTKEMKEMENIVEREKLLDSCVEKMQSKKHHWDHNVISPGTPFMMKCMGAVHKAAKLIAGEFPNLKVIVSDSSVPGEGEHKILSYMKREKATNSKEFSEMVHVVHGLDADLIMLTSLIGLPKIFSYRDSENIRMNRRDKELFYISELGRHFSRVIYSSIIELDKSGKAQNIDWSNANFISDVVLLLMFVGNDFLPNVPSLVMHNHAASIIMYSYAKYLLQCMEQSGKGEKFDPTPHYIVDYTSSFMINIKNMIKSMQSIREESVIGMFAKLYQSTIRHAQAETEDILEKPEIIQDMKDCFSGSNLKEHKFTKLMKDVTKNTATHKSFDVVYKVLADYFKNHHHKSLRTLKEPEDIIRACFTYPADVIHKINTSIILKYTDEIHREYYHKKFGDSSKMFRKDLVKEYLRGIVWAFNYYSYNDPPSWYWRYPHHFAPVMCDILDCYDEIDEAYIKDITTFEKGEPLTPYQQLVSILPKESMDACLPKTYTEILNNPKLDKFFPKEFEKDGNFTGISYKAVSLLPSMDIDLVKNITKEIDPILSEEESRKNKFGIDIVYTAVDSDISKKLVNLKEEREEKFKGDSLLSGVFSKVKESEMIFGTEEIQSEFKASVNAFKYVPPHIPIQNAYKYVTSNSIPKTKLISTLTRQLNSFKQLGGFVSMSEDQDLHNLSSNQRNRFTRKNQGSKRNADRQDKFEPKKAAKHEGDQKTPHDKKEEPTKPSTTETKEESTERKPIKASRGNPRPARNRRNEIAERDEREKAEKKKRREEENNKQAPATKKTKQDEPVASSSTSETTSVVTEKKTETVTSSESTSETTTPAATSTLSKSQKKRQRQKQNKKLKEAAASTNTTSAPSTSKPTTTKPTSETTAPAASTTTTKTTTTTTTTTTTPAAATAYSSTSAPPKSKLKDSANAKFKALLTKFTEKK